MRTLGLGSAAVVAAYTGLRWTASELRPTDPYVALLAGVALGGVISSLVYPWRPWTTRRTGLAFLAAGFMVFALGVFWQQVVGMSALSASRVLDASLALLLVGSPMVIVGVARYEWTWLRGQPDQEV